LKRGNLFSIPPQWRERKKCGRRQNLRYGASANT